MNGTSLAARSEKRDGKLSEQEFRRWFRAEICTRRTNLRQMLRRSPFVDKVVWKTFYEADEDGDCTMRHSRERITRRGVHVWKSPIHEVLCANQAFSVAQVPTDECRIIHDEYGTQDRVEKSKRNAKVAAKFIDSQGGKV